MFLTLGRSTSTILFLLSSLFLTGCLDNYIEKVVFEPSADLTNIHFSLIFSDDVKIKYDKKFKIKDFGYVYLEKYRKNQNPFQIGVNLKTSIVNEQDYVNIQPTDKLPNNMSLPVAFPMIAIRSNESLAPGFDFLAYIDVKYKSWIGVVALFDPTDESFPADLMLSQIFLRDQAGNPALVAQIFGPHQMADGTKKQAGVALFGNFRALTKQGVINTQQVVELTADEDPEYIELK